MKVTSILVLLAVLLVSVKSEVVELNAEQLLEIAYGEGEDTWFIKFYGPDCGFCKAMAQEWEDFDALIEEEELDIKLGAYNVHEPGNKTPETQILFPGPLPGLHLFPPGDKKFYEYPNPRINVKKEFYMSFALFEYENSHGYYKKAEYLYEEESPIVTIPGEKFDEFLTTGDNYFVMFFGPKCGWCKAFTPTWESFATQAKEKGSDFVVARMDGFSDMNIIQRYEARPWPSLVYITNGRFYRMDTEIVREIQNTEELFQYIENKEYLDEDEEHSGEDVGYLRFLKLKEAKEKSKAKKRQKELAAEEL